MSGMIEQLVQSKLVLLGEMGSGKTSLVQRFVRGQYFENQVRGCVQCGGRRFNGRRRRAAGARRACCPLPAWLPPCLQESTIGASFFTKTIPEKHVKFEIWCGTLLSLVCGSLGFILVLRACHKHHASQLPTSPAACSATLRVPPPGPASCSRQMPCVTPPRAAPPLPPPLSLLPHLLASGTQRDRSGTTA